MEGSFHVDNYEHENGPQNLRRGGGTPVCFTVIISVLVDVVYTNG
jgi:hypothetical protein